MDFPSIVMVYTFDKEIPQGDFVAKIGRSVLSEMMKNPRFSELHGRLSGKIGASNIITGMEGQAAVSEAVKWIADRTFMAPSEVVRPVEDNPELKRFFVFSGTEKFKIAKKGFFGKEKEKEVATNYSVVFYFWCSY